MKGSIGILLILAGIVLIGAAFVSPSFMIIGSSGVGPNSGTGGTTSGEIGGGSGPSGGSTVSTVYYTLGGSLTATPTTVNSGQSITLTFIVRGETNTPTAIFRLNGNTNIHSVQITGIGSYSYTWSTSGISGTYTTEIAYISEYTSGGYTQWSYLMGPTLTVNKAISKPVILSASASSNPATTGNTVSFTATINWGNSVGSEKWIVNQNDLTGNQYTFQNAGTYTVEVEASNSAGIGTYTFNEQVNAPTVTNPTNTTNTTTPPPNTNLTNVGTFWMATNSTLGTVELTATSNISLSPSVYLGTTTFYYVETSGMTENMNSLYMVINNQIYDISLTNTTTINSHIAYYLHVKLGAGLVTVAGFVTPSNGNPAIQVVSTVINDQSTTQILYVNYFTMGLGAALVIIGLFLIIRRII